MNGFASSVLSGSTYEESDGTVKVGKEDIFGIGVLEVRHGGYIFSRGRERIGGVERQEERLLRCEAKHYIG